MTIFIALGDLHGQTETLNRLKMVQAMYPSAITVFIGDYIDTFGMNQGFDLLQKIRYIKESNPLHTVVLRGSHEQAALNFFDGKDNISWPRLGGRKTLRAETQRLSGHQDALHDREFILNKRQDLISWVRTLPLIYKPGDKNKIVFSHLGLDLKSSNPLRDYTYYDDTMEMNLYDFKNYELVFSRNSLGISIVAGHVPTGEIDGKYIDNQKPPKQYSDHNPIYTIQYPNEMPRYLIDGGAIKGNPKILGNIGVFDGETGLLIDRFEDS